jgi:hypothetical protein
MAFSSKNRKLFRVFHRGVDADAYPGSLRRVIFLVARDRCA